ncbi:MAG: hypothetical protein LCH73_13390 [Proteobacteria bacterium]|nr:hypothetical protein [Pseudomonadota bacterium]
MPAGHSARGGQPRRATIQPDGCRDLIVRARPDGRCHWFVTDLANAAYTVAGDGQDHYLGFRLQPGTRIATTHLLSAVARLTPGDEAAARTALAEHTHHGASVAEALDALRHAPRVDAAARRLGVCTRTLERLVRAQTDRAPAGAGSAARPARCAPTPRGWRQRCSRAIEAG